MNIIQIRALIDGYREKADYFSREGNDESKALSYQLSMLNNSNLMAAHAQVWQGVYDATV